jgi:hypothetical protein
VSQSLVDLLHDGWKGGNFKIRRRYRRTHDAAFISIRWSCERLGQRSEEGNFFIAPKAHFKILFGCASITSNEALTRSTTHSFRSYREPRISSWAASRFRAGIEDGTLLPIKKMPSSSNIDNERFPSFAELEFELAHIYSISSTIEDDLLSSNTDNSSYTIASATIFSQTTMDTTSNSDTFTSFDDFHATAPSPSTTLSDGFCYRESSQAVPETHRQSIFTPECTPSDVHYSHSRWLDQPLQEEPHAWMIPRIATNQSEQKNTFHITRQENLSSSDQAMLEEARKLAEKEAREYWIWDEDVRKYKHYDQGCEEPVWYSPPS